MRKPRFIKPETIHIGDTIRVTEKILDAESSTVGTVATRQHQGQQTEYRTAQGVLLLVTFTGHQSARVTLIKEAESRQEATLW